MLGKNRALKRADKYVRGCDLDGILGEYEDLVEKDPSNWSAQNILGDLEAQSGRRDQAMERFQKIAEFYFQDGHVFKTIAMYKKMLRLIPEDATLMLKLSSQYADQGLVVDARENLMAALELLGGDAADAEEVFQVAHGLRGLDPDDQEVHQKLARILEAKLKTDQQNLAVLHRLKEIYHDLEDVEGEERHTVRISGLYIDQGRFGEARGELARLLELQPNNAEYQEQMRSVVSRLDEAAAETGQTEFVETEVEFREVTGMGEADTGAIALEEDPSAIDLDDTGSAVDTQETGESDVEPLAEIEVYLKYGMDRQARERIVSWLAEQAERSTGLQQLYDYFDERDLNTVMLDELSKGPGALVAQPAREDLPEPAPEKVAAPPLESLETTAHPVAEVAQTVAEPQAVVAQAVSAPVAEASSSGESLLGDVFKEFKEGVERDLGDDNAQTHYNLGIAYKEMNCLDEAVQEFQKASRDSEHFTASCSMLGLCFLEKEMPDLAREWIKKGLSEVSQGDEAYLGLRYDLGVAYQQEGDQTRALEIFREIYGKDLNFRDVGERMEALQGEAG